MKKYLLLNNIRSLHNVGAMFRTADGAGFDKIICGGFSPTPEDQRITKVALGAENAVLWEHSEYLENAIDELKEKGFLICALETGGEDLFSAKMTNHNVALVVGHEVEGISPEILKKCDRIFTIPMRGIKESLNVSVAGGIALYEIVRKMGEGKES